MKERVPVNDLEKRLRDTLQARAAGVRPHPETWGRVQAGIRRTQRLRWAYAGTATAALVAVAVLVVPGILARPGIQLGTDIATQPEEGGLGALQAPGEEQAAVTAPLDLLLGTADGLVTVGPQGYAGQSGEAVEAVAVRPGSRPDDLDAVYTSGCALLRHTRGPEGVDEADVGAGSSQGCASGPRFAPDGRDLAWVDRDESGWGLRVVGWDDDGEVSSRNAAFALDLAALAEANVTEVDHLAVLDWVWTAVSPEEARGFLVLQSQDAGSGPVRLLVLPVERQGDGGIALPEGEAPRLLDSDLGDQRIVAYRRTAAATWTLRLSSIGHLELYREDEGEELWSTVLDIPQTATEGLAWLDVADEQVVLGDGSGGAWAVAFLGGGWSEVEQIATPTAVLHGAAVGSQDPTAPAAPFEPVDSDDGAQEDLPAAVAETRAAILQAAANGDLDALAALADPSEFSYSFGDDGDPAAYWRDRVAAGEDVLGILRRLLEADAAVIPGEDGPDIFHWPAGTERAYESLSSAELVALTEVVGQQAMDAWAESGSYLGHRVGIRADGRWLSFTAGD